jgi:tetratricopeptide (TPR) repeat protein
MKKFQEGQMYAQQGEFADALRCYRIANSETPTNALILQEMASMLYYLGKNREAIEAGEQAIKLDPMLIWAYNWTGMAHVELGENDIAISLYDKAITTAKNKNDTFEEGNALKYKSQALMGAHRYDEALLCNDQAISCNGDIRYFLDRADIFKAMNNTDSALSVYKHVIDTWPEDFFGYFRAGEILSQQEKYSEALECFSAANTLIEQGLNSEVAFPSQISFYSDKFIKAISELSELSAVELLKEDLVIERKESELQKLVITSALEGKNIDQYSELMQQVIDTKAKILSIQKNPILYGYYDGLTFTLSQSYTVASVVTSGQLSIDSSNMGVDVATKLISLVPLLGDTISSTAQGVWNFVRTAQIIKAANNVTKLASSITEFESLMQDVIIESIDNRKNELLALREEPKKVLTHFDTLKSFCDKMRIKAEDTIYGIRYETFAQKLGNQEASYLISHFISNGGIYDNQPATAIPLAIKKQKLIELLVSSDVITGSNSFVIEDKQEKAGVKGSLVPPSSGTTRLQIAPNDIDLDIQVADSITNSSPTNELKATSTNLAKRILARCELSVSHGKNLLHIDGEEETFLQDCARALRKHKNIISRLIQDEDLRDEAVQELSREYQHHSVFTINTKWSGTLCCTKHILHIDNNINHHDILLQALGAYEEGFDI